MTEDLPDLDLAELLTGMPGLSTEVATVYVQAACVCLEGNSHTPGVSFNCAGWKKADYHLLWPRYADMEQVIRTWADKQEATEQGAYGVAIALVRQLANKVVWQRSAKGPGFDFWIGDAGADPKPKLFQGTSRLEVSGILSGNEAIASRLKRKIAQVTPSNGLGWDAYVVVVEFGAPQARVAYQ